MLVPRSQIPIQITNLKKPLNKPDRAVVLLTMNGGRGPTSVGPAKAHAMTKDAARRGFSAVFASILHRVT